MSNPYGPQSPFPQQQAPQQAAQPYPAPQPGQAWNQPSYPTQGVTFGAPPKQSNTIAIIAIVMSGLALLGVIGIAVFIGFGVASGSGVLTGKVEPSGTSVSADVLTKELTTVIEDDGGYVGRIDCPATSAVGQGLVTVCHGSVDDYDWTGIVVFEDDSGTFTLQEL